MMRWIKSWLSKGTAQAPKRRREDPLDPLASYGAASEALSRNDRNARRLLAGAPETPPEMLFYLAGDGDEDVRARVAGNPATPFKAAGLLVDDSAGSVRAELSGKLARLLPDLRAGEAARLREDVIATLEALARDREARVRAMLAQELARLPEAPTALVRTLALDPDCTVAGPILEHSRLLRDEDLLEIIAASRAKGALSAIARRTSVSEAVSDDIAASLEIPAIATLLANPQARIREETMDMIVDQARTAQALHEPLVMRTDLSVRTMCRISDFVAAELIERLAQRGGLDDATRGHLRARLRERAAAEAMDRTDDGTPLADRRVREKVAIAHTQGHLDAEEVAGFVAEGQRPAVVASLSARAGVPIEIVERILKSASPKAVTALCWRAGLPMRLAMEIQRTIARVPHQDLLLARRGTDYPLPEETMIWHLEFFGIPAAQDGGRRQA